MRFKKFPLQQKIFSGGEETKGSRKDWEERRQNRRSIETQGEGKGCLQSKGCCFQEEVFTQEFQEESVPEKRQ